MESASLGGIFDLLELRHTLIIHLIDVTQSTYFVPECEAGVPGRRVVYCLEGIVGRWHRGKGPVVNCWLALINIQRLLK